MSWGNGRRARFEETAVVHLNELIRVATGTCRSRDTAEDVVQETYLRAWKYWDSFESGTNCRAWLYTIMFNVIRAREGRALTTVSIDNPDAVALLPSVPPTTLGLTDALTMFATLPEDYRLPLLLVTIQGFSYRETAEMLGIPIGTVMSRLHRGRDAMRRLLEEKPRAATHGRRSR